MMLVAKGGRVTITRGGCCVIITNVNVVQRLIITEHSSRNVLSVLITYKWWISLQKICGYFRFNKFVLKNVCNIYFIVKVDLDKTPFWFCVGGTTNAYR